jgi:hypothetical protein
MTGSWLPWKLADLLFPIVAAVERRLDLEASLK